MRGRRAAALAAALVFLISTTVQLPAAAPEALSEGKHLGQT